MKRKIFESIVFFCVIFITGCTHLSYKNSFSNTRIKADTESQKIKIKKIAIFPFADYSYDQEFIKPLLWGLNSRILEDLTDEFIKRGIMVTVQEDTQGLLISEGIISPFDRSELNESLYMIREELKKEGRKKTYSDLSLEKELQRKDYSKEMICEIEKSIENINPQEQDVNEEELILSRLLTMLSLGRRGTTAGGVTVGLSREKIIDLGRKLDVDVIVRGRLIEAGTLEKTGGPAFSNQGVIPFFLGPVKDFLIGRQDKGGAIGYARKKEYEKDLVDTYSVKHYPTGKKSSVIQVRIYLQDARNGEIIWSGRAEATCEPGIFKEYHKELFDSVSKKVCSALAEDLFEDPLEAQAAAGLKNRGVISKKD